MKYCRNCGQPIDDDSEFCTHCGSTFNGTKEVHFWTKLKSNQQIALVITGLWVLIHLCFLAADYDSPIKKRYFNDIWLYDTNFSTFAAYGLGEFAFYAILIPAFIWGIAYIYFKNKKIGIGLSVVLSVLLLSSWGISSYKSHKEEYGTPINREFYGCSLGDDYKSVYKKISKKFKNHIDQDLSDEETIVLNDIDYGSRRYNRMRFDFYKGKVYQVYFRQSFDYENEKLGAHKKIQEIMEGKGYRHDPQKYNKYSNSFYYFDNSTELSIRYSVREYDGDVQQVQLYYYDFNSHQRDEGL